VVIQFGTGEDEHLPAPKTGGLYNCKEQTANQASDHRGYVAKSANGVTRPDLRSRDFEDLAYGCPGEEVVENACRVSPELFS